MDTIDTLHPPEIEKKEPKMTLNKVFIGIKRGKVSKPKNVKKPKLKKK